MFKEAPIVYGFSPFSLWKKERGDSLEIISLRLPELAQLGVNTVWLQPITEAGADFKRLVDKARALNIKVMLDVPINHSSSEHRFVQDVAEKGEQSEYYNFYQHNIGNDPYAAKAKSKTLGKADFIYYFWENMFNLDYSQESLRNFMYENLAFWIQEYDIDGFHFDASWGPSSRWPPFYRDLSSFLRKVKPDLILMAEDKIGYPSAYKGFDHPHLKDSGFDWAYDWDNINTKWISRWAFQVGHKIEDTVFNRGDSLKAAQLFVEALSFSAGAGEVQAVRYLENNDTPGFLRYHNLEQLKFAAEAMFVLPGVPLIFHGLETGNDHDLYQLADFDPETPMKDVHKEWELWPFFHNLISIRKGSKALAFGNLENLKFKGAKVFFDRCYADQMVSVELDFARLRAKINGEEF